MTPELGPGLQQHLRHYKIGIFIQSSAYSLGSLRRTRLIVTDGVVDNTIRLVLLIRLLHNSTLLLSHHLGLNIKMAESLHESNFKVIIVGGSVAGLTLANSLSRRNIDFLVLEARDQIAPPVGAAIAVLSNGARILDQLGMFDDICPYMAPIEAIYQCERMGSY